MEFLSGSLALENRPTESGIWTLLHNKLIGYHGQMGYRIPSVSVPLKDNIPSFIIISHELGIILIDVIDERIQSIDESHEFFILGDGKSIYSRYVVVDNFKREIINRLGKARPLFDRKRNELTIPIKSVMVFAQNTGNELSTVRDPDSTADLIIGGSSIDADLDTFITAAKLETPLADPIIDLVVSYLEGTSIFSKPQPIIANVTPSKRNDFIQLSNKHVFKLDQLQRKIALQVPNGPQRIRGLAGTGKTIILSLKAALTHKDFSDFAILFTFNTKSLYPQIRNRISEYYTREALKEVDWSKLEIRHAWGGGTTMPGVYSSICNRLGIRPRTYSDVRSERDPLDAIFRDLLTNHRARLVPMYDMILIDEAQDFPDSFFEVLFYLAKEPKRIIWAYDDFQSLKEIRPREPQEIFGRNGNGEPNIPNEALQGQYPGEIDKDFILPNCYRNPRVTLMLAHGLTLGLYRKEGIIQIIDTRRSWEALGYKVLQPSSVERYKVGDHIELIRPDEYNRNILASLIQEQGGDEKSLFSFREFNNRPEELAFLISEIERLVRNEGIDPAEIIIIMIDVAAAKDLFVRIRQELNARGIQAITPGYIEDAALFKEPGCVTLTTPFRAKGNEANIVFVVGCDRVTADATLRARNSLFVSITRSNGWCYLSGVGTNANTLQDEIASILTNYPKFLFDYPDDEELERRRILLSRDDQEVEQTQQLLDAIIATKEDILIEKLKAHPGLLEKILKSNK